MKFSKIFTLICLLACLTACRGWYSEKPPVHLNPNLDWQAKYKGQQLSLTPPSGTVPWGVDAVYSNNSSHAQLQNDDTAFLLGKNLNGTFVKKVPIPVTRDLLKRGQERFDIYCAACHDRAGTGHGTVAERGLVPPPNYSDPRVLAYSDGELFNIISNGIRTMPAYRKQVSEADRWAIVAYVRALQKMRTATLDDVPANMRSEISQ